MTDAARSKAAVDSFTYHGGNLGAARRLFPDAPQPWIDLSTGINPHAYPLPALHAESWTRLPECVDLTRLEAVAANRYGVAEPGNVIAAPGTQMLIQMIARLLAPARVGILGHTYGGHSEAWRGTGAQFDSVSTIGALAAFEVAVIVNPNNPDGRLVARADLLELVLALARNNGVLIVDEAFIDLIEGEASLAPALPASRTIVLRSFGKTYGLAGLRLGFAIASPDLAEPLRAALGAWPVSGPALAIGAAALADEGWLGGTRGLLKAEAQRLDAILAAAGASVLGGTSLFRLIDHPRALELFAQLLQRGILARPFAGRPSRLRFGLPGGSEAWARLEQALAEFGR